MNAGAADVPALRCTDWRGWPAESIAPLLERETERWARDFHWDQRWSFAQVDAAREAGRLPGLVAALAGGTAQGWTFFLRHANEFQIGTIVSNGVATTRALLTAALLSPLAEQASVVLFAPAVPGIEDELHAQGVRSEAYDYLVVEQVQDALGTQDGTVFRSMAAGDLGSVAALLGGAYRHTSFLRPFVTGGAPDEWRHYVEQLVETRGCGEFLAEASVVVDETSAPGQLRGAVLATRLSPGTGHIAQIAVGPHARGRGLARRLLGHSLRALRAQGLNRVSLLVARTNTAARGLYASVGFRPAGVFVTGRRD